EATDLTPQRPHRPVDRGTGVVPGIGHGAELVADQAAHQAGPAVRADLLTAGGPMQLLEGPGPLLLADRGLEHRVDLLDGRGDLEPSEPVAADGLRTQLAQRLEVDAGELAAEHRPHLVGEVDAAAGGEGREPLRARPARHEGAHGAPALGLGAVGDAAPRADQQTRLSAAGQIAQTAVRIALDGLERAAPLLGQLPEDVEEVRAEPA